MHANASLSEAENLGSARFVAEPPLATYVDFPPSAALPFRVVVLGSDRLCVEMIALCVAAAVRNSTVSIATTIEAAIRLVEADLPDLLICDVEATDGDVLAAFSDWLVSDVFAPRIFVVATRIAPLIVEQLSHLRVLGAFDAGSEDAEMLGAALDAVLGGRPYWSPRILEIMIRECLSPHSILRRLTAAERRVIRVIGTGASDKAAADRLGLKSSTIASIRRSLHRKLDVHDKRSLCRVSVSLGFVRPGGSCIRQVARLR